MLCMCQRCGVLPSLLYLQLNFRIFLVKQALRDYGRPDEIFVTRMQVLKITGDLMQKLIHCSGAICVRFRRFNRVKEATCRDCKVVRECR